MIARPKFSTTVVIALLAVTALLIAAAVVIGRDTEPRGRTVVTVRLWDQQVAAAYRRSFDEFTRRHPAIEVRVNVVAYASYFDALRADVAGGSADDIFWISNAYFAPYADSRRLVDITNTRKISQVILRGAAVDALEPPPVLASVIASTGRRTSRDLRIGLATRPLASGGPSRKRFKTAPSKTSWLRM